MVIAHRGASDEAPENTLPAFLRAVEVGSDGIETDVHATRDGHLVLMHDPRLDRTTDGSGSIAESTLAEIRALDAGSWFDQSFKGTQVPLLGELLQACGHAIPIVIELKCDGVEARVVAEVNRYKSSLCGITYTSFQLDRLIALKSVDPEAACGYLIRPEANESVRADELLALGINQICPKANGLTAEAVRTWRQAGLSVRAWSVRNEERMRRCASIGVDGFTTDFPARALKVLGRTSSSA